MGPVSALTVENYNYHLPNSGTTAHLPNSGTTTSLENQASQVYIIFHRSAPRNEELRKTVFGHRPKSQNKNISKLSREK